MGRESLMHTEHTPKLIPGMFFSSEAVYLTNLASAENSQRNESGHGHGSGHGSDHGSGRVSPHENGHVTPHESGHDLMMGYIIMEWNEYNYTL